MPNIDRDQFLKIIAQIESSGGKNLNHPVIESGLQAGQQAMGNYGLLPNTVQELTNRARLQKQVTPEMEEASRNPASLRENPALQQVYAEQLANHVLDKTQDPEMAAFAWNAGHNLKPDEIKKRDYLNNSYVKKFQKIRELLGKK